MGGRAVTYASSFQEATTRSSSHLSKCSAGQISPRHQRIRPDAIIVINATLNKLSKTMLHKGNYIRA